MGTATSRFTDVIESAFGSEEAADIREAYEEACEEEDDDEEGTEPIEPEASTSEGAKRKQSSAPPKHKLPCTEGCSLEDATVYYPTLSDEGEPSSCCGGPTVYILSQVQLSHGCCWLQLSFQCGH